MNYLLYEKASKTCMQKSCNHSEKEFRSRIAFATIEILDKSTQHSNPHPVLYRLTWRVLEKFNDNKQ